MADHNCRDIVDRPGAEQAAAARRPSPRRSPLAALGGEGVFLFMLVNAILLASLGGLFAYWLLRVVRTAATTPARMTGRSAALVLGARAVDGRPSPEFRRRLDRALAVRESGPIVVLGGSPNGESIPEAIAGREYLLGRGLPPEAVIVEIDSRNTLENLVAARTLLAPAGGAPPLLITSRFHLARACFIARSLAIAHVPCAAEDRLRLDMRTLLRMCREAYFLACYAVDQLFARLVDRAPMLHRLAAGYRPIGGWPLVRF